MGLTIEQQVISLDLARQLKALKVKQDSLWWWGLGKGESRPRLLLKLYIYYIGLNGVTYKDREITGLISAFTVAELGELLPFSQTNKQYCRSAKQKLGSFICEYESLTDSECFISNTEANARARMLVYLLESGKLKLSDMEQ